MEMEKVMAMKIYKAGESQIRLNNSIKIVLMIRKTKNSS